ncbi:MAG: right-handed parallel beta-helix repeat-containing protein [Firmicutes bacterium]|nr:right-handed parallel beta-helix repeat-containing protein [Bacillota bacterium]
MKKKALSLIICLLLAVSSAAARPARAETSTVWYFSAFGESVSSASNNFSGSADTGEVRVWSTNGKGKLQPASTDGLAFYYTAIDPETTNFKLTATANVNSWKLSNGQEGFGLMAADAVGENGSSTRFWNNSYMAVVSKVQYKSNTNKTITMKLGIGSQAKTGVTPENIGDDLQLIDGSLFSSSMVTFERSCEGKGTGEYNVVGNYTGDAPTGTVDDPLTSFTFTIEKDNTGYSVSYTDQNGDTVKQQYYGAEALNHLDEDNVYVGFFASRNADVTFTDISFTTSSVSGDPQGGDEPDTEVDPEYSIESSKYSNSGDYTMIYYGNMDGEVSVVRNADQQLLYTGRAQANTRLDIPLTVSKGTTTFRLTITPDPDFRPGEHQILSSYEPKRLSHSVTYNVNDSDVVYVSPSGVSSAVGSRTAPQDIQTALNRARPGQTIIMLEGVYDIHAIYDSDDDSDVRLTIDRGLNGAAGSEIWLKGDSDAPEPPLIDFGGTESGLLLDADYWHFYGFDVTNTRSGQPGILVSGSHNVLEMLMTYKNGNSGIQLSRRKSIDAREYWPSYNRIVNCTSMFNADQGYEDADGFAAKLSCGDGNLFDGCIAYYNADDGWDLYSKTELGSIGRVVIKNCVSFKNGFQIDDQDQEFSAGNGNGFKMGGENMSGGHSIINSIAFANKNKGIDSNGCPDIHVRNCTSYDNGQSNIALYTGAPQDTAFRVEGMLSYRSSNTADDQLQPKGSQSYRDLLDESNYFYGSGSSRNSKGKTVADDWFVSLDTAAAIAGISRDEDGSIDLHGYLELTDSAPGDCGAVIPSDEETGTWRFSAFGESVSLKNNGYVGSVDIDSVRVYSTGNKGKLRPASNDGLAFYFTEIDPGTENFRLSATANVGSWSYTNGQEGFGLMAADAVGENGSTEVFWNNSYMAAITKVQYPNEDGDSIIMKLGVGSLARTGITPENIGSDPAAQLSSEMLPLERSCEPEGPGTYNIVGNYTNDPAPTGTIDEPLTSFSLCVEKSNTGYSVSYTGPDGETVKQQYYDTEALSQLDGKVYVGFFAARNADVTFTDISLSITDPETDPPAELPPHSEDHTLSAVEEIPATCEEAGVSAYWICDDCGRLFADEDGTEEIEEPGEIEALGHLWGEPSYEWADDHSSVTGTAVCERDESHVVSETVTAESDMNMEPFCEDPGLMIYTSAEFENELFEAQTADEEIPALGHAWGEPEWSWTGTGSASATFTCERESAHTLTLPAEIEISGGTATATVELDGETYTDSVELPSEGQLGDVDLDGEVTAADLTALARHVAGISELTDPQALANADVTFDDEVGATDLTKLARYIARIIDSMEE